MRLTCNVRNISLAEGADDQKIVTRYWSAFTNTDMLVKQTYQASHVSNGIAFYTASDKVTTQLIQYSVLTFYTAIVLVVGRYLRGFFSKGAEKVILKEMPYPDDLILICESVVSSRLEDKLER